MKEILYRIGILKRPKMKPVHVIMCDEEIIGVLTWRKENDGWADTVKFPLTGETIQTSDNLYEVILINHLIEKGVITYHCKQL